jgi:large subunit ribosomal protein L29
VKTDQVLQDMRQLEGDELANRLKLARRELYELRFKMAVGQLEDSSQIRKIRKDIARILTVIHQRELGEVFAESPQQPETPTELSTAEGEAEVGAETDSEETEEISEVEDNDDDEDEDDEEKEEDDDSDR